jgi:catechol 2,3-dioxygenase-like lactoylglutathione lyase family enzyme
MRIHHLAMRSAEPARLERFYTGVLGLAVVRRDPSRGSVWLRAGEAIVMIEPRSGGEPSIPEGSMELVAFAVGPDQAEDLRARLTHSGVAIEGETVYTMYFRDPDGRRIALSTLDPSTIG